MWACEDKDIKGTYLENIIDTDLEIKLKFKKILSLAIIARQNKSWYWLFDQEKPDTSNSISFDKNNWQ